MLSFFPRGVLDEILNLIESVSEGFPSYSCIILGLLVLADTIGGLILTGVFVTFISWSSDFS